MKPYQKSALRRRLINELSNIAIAVWILVAIIWIMALSNMNKYTVHTTVRPHHMVVATPTPKPLTDEEYIKSLPMGNLVWGIYRKESSAGKNDGCYPEGLFNGFGYGWNGHQYPCFSSMREVARKVSNWLEENAYMGTLGELCYYNTGYKNMSDCDYAESVLRLL